MINFILKGHDLPHEVQTIIQVFFPNKRYYEKEEIELKGITVVSELTTDFSGAYFYEDGNLILKKKYYYDKIDTPREKKRVIKMSLYLCLKEVTGYEPRWGMITGIRPAKTVNELFDEGHDKEYVMNYLTKMYCASKEKARLAINVAEAERDILKNNTKKDYSLYIGIPFCPSRCLYCSFTSYALSQYGKRVDEYLDKLIEELEFISQNMEGKRLMTVYVGGGTPTSLNEKQLERLLKAVKENFDLENALEYTVEAGRPDTITKEKLELLKSYKVERISINPQTMNLKTLEEIGRNHTVSQVVEVYNEAREIGFKNINMDLILGLPNETEEDVKNTMEEILKLNPSSITVHTLAVKRASRLKENLEKYDFVQTELMEKMIEISFEYAKKMDMEPYYMYRQKNMVGNFENVGYSKKGFESIYNIEIMEEKQTVIAAGAGAVSKIYDFETNGISRIFNVKSVEEYISRFEEMLERKRAGGF